MARRRKRSKSMRAIRKTMYLYDAFPTRSGANGAVKSLRPLCGQSGVVARKLDQPEGGGRLKFGVFVNRACKI